MSIEEFGFESRNEVQDKNANADTPNTLRRTLRNQNLGNLKDITSADLKIQDGIKKQGESLGNALSNYIMKENYEDYLAKTVKQRTNAAYQLGLTKVDKDFQLEDGRDIRDFKYGREADKGTSAGLNIQNQINGFMLDAQVNIDKYQDKTREDFAKEVIYPEWQKYADMYGEKNPALLRAITEEFSKAAFKLTTEQVKAHSAYVQEKSAAEAKQGAHTQVDIFVDDIQKSVKPEDRQRNIDVLGNYFRYENSAAPNQSREAWEEQQKEVIIERIQNDGIMAYKALQQTGAIKEFGDKSRRAIDAAVSKYDTKFKQRIDTAINGLEGLTIKDTTDPYELSEMIAQIQQQEMEIIDMLKNDSSDTEAAKNSASEGFKRLQKLKEKIEDVLDKQQKVNDEETMIESAIATGDSVIVNSTKEHYGEKRVEEVRNRVFLDKIENITGQEDVTPITFAKSLTKDLNVLAITIDEIKQNGNTPNTLVKQALKNLAGNLPSMVDENGNFMLEAQSTLKVINDLQRAMNDQGRSSVLTKEEEEKLRFLETRINNNMSAETALNEWEKFQEGKENAGVRGLNISSMYKDDADRYNEENDTSFNINEYVAEKAEDILGTSISYKSLSEFKYHLDAGIKIYKDQKAAEQYAKDQMMKNNVFVNGNSVKGGKMIENWGLVDDTKLNKTLDNTNFTNEQKEELLKLHKEGVLPQNSVQDILNFAFNNDDTFRDILGQVSTDGTRLKFNEAIGINIEVYNGDDNIYIEGYSSDTIRIPRDKFNLISTYKTHIDYKNYKVDQATAKANRKRVLSNPKVGLHEYSYKIDQDLIKRERERIKREKEGK